MKVTHYPSTLASVVWTTRLGEDSLVLLFGNHGSIRLCSFSLRGRTRWLTGYYKTSYTVITKNTLRQIRHYCTPLKIVRQKPNVENFNEALY